VKKTIVLAMVLALVAIAAPTYTQGPPVANIFAKITDPAKPVLGQNPPTIGRPDFTVRGIAWTTVPGLAPSLRVDVYAKAMDVGGINPPQIYLGSLPLTAANESDINRGNVGWHMDVRGILPAGNYRFVAKVVNASLPANPTTPHFAMTESPTTYLMNGCSARALLLDPVDSNAGPNSSQLADQCSAPHYPR